MRWFFLKRSVWLLVTISCIAIACFATFFSQNQQYLYQYVDVVNEDPLFALPGVDIPQMRSLIRALKHDADAISKLYPSPQRKILEQFMYPRVFLIAVTDTEEKRRKLLEHPTWTNAVTYHFALKKTIRTYTSYTLRLATVFENMENRAIYFHQGSIRPSSVARTLREAARLAISFDNTESTRLFCLIGHGSSCDRGVTFVSTTPIKTEEVSAIPDRIKLLRTIADAFVSGPGIGRNRNPSIDPLPNVQVQEAPLVLLHDSVCASEFNPVWYMLWWQTSNVHDLREVRILPLNELFFNDLSRFKNDEYNQELARSGITYRFQPTNAYTCLEYGHDAGRVTGAFHIFTQLTQKPIFSADNISDHQRDEISELLELEKQIIRSRKVISERNVEEYFRLAELFSKKGILQKILDREHLERYKQLSSEWRSKSARLPEVLAHYDDLAKILRRYVGLEPLPFNFMLLTHSGFPTMLLFSNETTPYSGGLPVEGLTPSGLQKQRLITVRYTETLIDAFPPEKMRMYINEVEKKIVELNANEKKEDK